MRRDDLIRLIDSAILEAIGLGNKLTALVLELPKLDTDVSMTEMKTAEYQITDVLRKLINANARLDPLPELRPDPTEQDEDDEKTDKLYDDWSTR